ncbi:ABC transporter ATP-binding protein [bacterium]|nr:ABC transporter ATP-binding protein [bacterium]
MGVLLELKDICKSYPSGAGGTLSVLQDVSLSVEQGDFISIMGPSGSGKSTLLNIAGTLDAPTSGRILFREKDLADLKQKERTRFRNRHLGFVFQLHHLLPQCTVLENVLIPALPAGVDSRLTDYACHLLERVGLDQRLHEMPGHLSGGERQRVAVVRALINRPEILLADEPTGSLDQNTASRMGVLLQEINRDYGTSLILVTHSPELAGLANRTYRLHEGTLHLS